MLNLSQSRLVILCKSYLVVAEKLRRQTLNSIVETRNVLINVVGM